MQDIYLVVHDQVYNATTFVDEHPYVQDFSYDSVAPSRTNSIAYANAQIPKQACALRQLRLTL